MEENKNNNQTGDSNLGGLQRLMMLHGNLTPYEQMVYLIIGRYSLGYCRPNTNVPADKGYNRNTKAWADSIGISKSSFIRAIKSLSERNLIAVHKGSQFRADGGSYPNYYSIVFYPELQIKHNIYFNTGGLPNSKPKNNKYVNIDDYFINDNNEIKPLLKPDQRNKKKKVPTKEWRDFIDRGGKSPAVKPTQQQLNEYLEQQNAV